MKRIALALALTLGIGLMAAPAQAVTAQDSATLSVTISTVVTLSFTDDTTDFPPLNPPASGAQQTTDPDTLSYDVSTNSPTGYVVDIQTAAAGEGGLFKIRKGESSGTFTPIPATAGANVNLTGWRTTSAPGSNSYLEDVQVEIAAGRAPGTTSRVLNFIATAS